MLAVPISHIAFPASMKDQPGAWTTLSEQIALPFVSLSLSHFQVGDVSVQLCAACFAVVTADPFS